MVQMGVGGQRLLAVGRGGYQCCGGGRRQPQRAAVSRERWRQVRPHVLPGRRAWRSTLLCGCRVQPARRCPRMRPPWGGGTAAFEGVGRRGVRLLGSTLALVGSWAKALAPATPLAPLSLLGASCIPPSVDVHG